MRNAKLGNHLNCNELFFFRNMLLVHLCITSSCKCNVFFFNLLNLEPETRYLSLEPSAAMNGGFIALLKRQVSYFCYVTEY